MSQLNVSQMQMLPAETAKQYVQGPIEKRKFQDIPWLILYGVCFVIFLVFFIIVGTTVNEEKSNADACKELFKRAGKAWSVAILLPIGLGAGFILATPYVAGCIVWSIIIVRNLLFAVLGIIFFAISKGNAGIIILGILFLLVSAIMFAITYCMRKKIQIGIILIKASGIFFQQNFGIIASPIITIVGFSLYLIMAFFAIFYSVMILINPDNEKYKSKVGFTKLIYAYQMIFSYWTGYIFLLLCSLQVGISTAFWYFSQDLGQNKRAVPNALHKALVWPFRYHIGSICLGGLILAILEYFKSLTSRKNNRSNNILIICLRFCLRRLIEWLKRFTKLAVIMIAVSGDSFCKSASQAFSLVFENLVQYIVLQDIKQMYINSGKYIIVIVTSIISIMVLMKDVDLTFTLFIVIIIMIFVSIAITVIILNVISASADVLLFCLVLDKSANGLVKKGPAIMGEIEKLTNSNKNDVTQLDVEKKIQMTQNQQFQQQQQQYYQQYQQQNNTQPAQQQYKPIVTNPTNH